MLSACSDAGSSSLSTDLMADAGGFDTNGVPSNDGGTSLDGDGAAQSLDAGRGDAESLDAPGSSLSPELVPGSHVQVAEGRIDVRSMDFGDVKRVLGTPTRRTASANTRSYEYELSQGVLLTIWFANANLDSDDGSPNDVDDGDHVLWIAVEGGFFGTTPLGMGMGDPRTKVEAASPTGYGPAPNLTSVSSPPGTLAQYFERGLLVSYDAADRVRTLTICRLYAQAPDGEIDPAGGQLHFGGGTDLAAFRGLAAPGTELTQVRVQLGDPDAEGMVTLGGQSLRLLSYSLIGIEVFALGGSSRVLFVSLHAPYYGVTSGGVGIGSTRTALETWLGTEGFAAGRACSGTNIVGYESTNPARRMGATYSTDASPIATTLTVQLPQCP